MTAQAVLGTFPAVLSLLVIPGAAAQTAPLPVAEVATIPDERDAWDRAARYYDRELASNDLLSEGLISIKYALVHTGLDDPAIVAVVAARVATLAPETIPRLETLYATRWFTEPARAFYLTGEVMREALARRSIAFTPASAGLFDRAWPQYRQPITDAWGPYVQGRGTMDDAIAKMVGALRTPK